MLSDRNDIIVVITDEAHRSQYDILAMNMRTAWPNAALGLLVRYSFPVNRKNQRSIWGLRQCVQFSQSIEDRATVPLYYQDRIPEVMLSNDHFSEELYDIIDESGIDDKHEEKLERKFSQMYQIITRDDRLEKVAKDIVEHFTSRGDRGKAMVISIDKATCVIMYEVQKYWKEHLGTLKKELDDAPDDEKEALSDVYQYLSETDMAVVVSSSQNDIANIDAKGGDIRPHIERGNREDLETKFKDPDDPFRIVFVCAMWITGFDVPSCSTIYIDKPMRNHTLMQTIARANRVFKDKVNGLIVDYANIFKKLEQALSIYGAPDGGGGKPIQDKEELKLELIESIDNLVGYLNGLGVDLDDVVGEQDINIRLQKFGGVVMSL